MQQRQTQRGNKSVNYTLPAPVGGLNARDSVDKMNQADAIVMDNYIPMDTKVVLRRGYAEYVRLNAAVKTLAEYKKARRGPIDCRSRRQSLEYYFEGACDAAVTEFQG